MSVLQGKRVVMNFREAAEYVYLNDDMTFLDYPEDNDARGMLSVAACIVADIFGRSEAEMRKELLKHHNGA